MIKKLKYKYIWDRIFLERLSEPLHLNFFSLFVKLFGNYEKQIEWDLILKQQHSYGIMKAAKLAKELKIDSMTVIEFGVANGTGLINIQSICKKITKLLDIKFNIYGFDNLVGLPKPEGFKDHPDLYQESDYPLQDIEKLKNRLNENTKLIIGDVKDTVPEFKKNDFKNSPIGFVSFDLDYYSSTKNALDILNIESENLLPIIDIYFDDISDYKHNSKCGQYLAIDEFNKNQALRLLEQHKFLRKKRIFQRAKWIDHMYQLHVLDHKEKNSSDKRKRKILENFHF